MVRVAGGRFCGMEVAIVCVWESEAKENGREKGGATAAEDQRKIKYTREKRHVM